MSSAEVAFRAWRHIGQRLERGAVQKGRRPESRVPVRPRGSLFPRQDGWLELWQRNFTLDDSSITMLSDGKIDFFGNPELFVGNPVNWFRDPKSGVVSPMIYGKSIDYRNDALVGDVKYVWELGRHQHLLPLAVAYAIGSDRKIAEIIAAQIDSWIRENPYGMGIHWCSALEISLRLISWSMVHSVLTLRDGDAGLFGIVKDPTALGQSIYEQSVFLRNFLSRYSSANNHLIGELTGLWITGQVFDLGPESNLWLERVQRELEAEAGKQVFNDGVSKEQAVYYHLWVLEYLLLCFLTGERYGRNFSQTFRGRIRSMAKFLEDISAPGGSPPQIGDADNGFAARFEPAWPTEPYSDVLSAVACTLSGPSEPDQLTHISHKAYWYGLIIGRMPNMAAAMNGNNTKNAYPRIYSEGGYAILGDGRIHIVFDAGSLGYPSIAAHGHADALSICLAIDGHWWLVDPGTYAYHSKSEWRDYFRGTSAHNTIIVDGENQSEIGGPFLWSRRAKARLLDCSVSRDIQSASGSHDGYSKKKITHHREIKFSTASSEIVIEDFVTGSGAHEIDIHFHFSPKVRTPQFHQDKDTVLSISHTSASGILKIYLDPVLKWRCTTGSSRPLLGWYSSALGILEPSTVLKGHYTGSLPMTITTRIVILDA